MANLYNDVLLENLIQNPHLLGHLMGKDKLTEIHSEWIRYCWDSDLPRALQAFRGGYKSTSIDVVGIVRWFLINPNDRIAIIRKSMTDASTIVHSVKQAMELPEIRELFRFAHGFYPRTIISRDDRLRYNFKSTITPEVSLTAHGIDGSLTGMHYDKIICDDIITLKDRISRAERERTKEMVREISTNIIDPDKGSIWIGTPWHIDDAWNEIGTFADIAMYPARECPFITEKQLEQKRKATTPFLYAANYDLELRKDENLMFSDPQMLKGWDYSKRSYAHLDCAYDGNHYCALTIFSALEGQEYKKCKRFQVVGFTYPGNVKAWLNEISRYYRKYKCNWIYIETNPDKGYTATKLNELGLRTKSYSETENKHIKISTNIYEYWDKLGFSPDTDPEYLNQILDYREGSEPDDAPDSLASIIRETCRPHKARARGLYQY